ncbi:glutathione transferase GstA [Massilia solisilvae]|uniref:Glutathione transferase GstA n=1 Tax=Massilia solisilvae TaxID=1811225 RepID=A0ABT2BDW7_9BURK|nr:glutathione transferase GstA [Massilia solisilvae]MCS0606635.1 glutathione transferase GstA [Massilia solisilvae]
MKLYFSPGACSLSPRIVLNEAGIPFTAEQVDVRKKVTASGADFRTINPKGYVPALQLDDGKVLTEGAAIVQYIADLAPASNLAPAAGSFARYQLMEWLNYIAAEVHKGFSPLFMPGTSDDAKAAARTAVGNRLNYIEQQMAGHDYLMGSQFTVADAYLFTVLGWCGYVGMSLDDWPALKSYMARVGGRPAVQQALRDEGLVK